MASTLSATMNALCEGVERYSHAEDLWEICCSPQSALVAEADRKGLIGRRLTLDNGWDWLKKDTSDRALTLVKEKKPRHVWASPPCTHVTSTQNLNLRHEDPARARRLLWKRLETRQMVRNIIPIFQEALENGGDI